MKPIGLILSAGFGNRLRPITDYWPKPLIPFLGTTPLALAIYRLIKLGIDEIWINTHYRADDFKPYVTLIPHIIKISHEPKILGTGGALNFLRDKVHEQDLLIINGDIVADFDLESLILNHQETKAVATMMLLQKTIPGESAVWHHKNRVTAIQKEYFAGSVPSNFACAQVLSPAFLRLLPESGFFDIINYGYREAIKENLPISSQIHRGFWADIGSIKSFYSTIVSLVQINNPVELRSTLDSLYVNETRYWHHLPPILECGSVIDPIYSSNSQVIRSVVDKNAFVDSSAKVIDSIVLSGGVLKKNQEVNQSIIGPFGIIDCSNFT